LTKSILIKLGQQRELGLRL